LPDRRPSRPAIGFPHRIATLVLLTLALAVRAQEPPSGWRGDGSGRYPTADPPTTWSRTSATVAALRYASHKPADPDTATSMPDGVIRDWLILGPLPLLKGDPGDDTALPDEAALAPEVDQEAAGKRWQKVTLDSAYLDFTRLLGKLPGDNAAALAFTNIYSPAGGAFRLNLTAIGAAQVYLNGKKTAGDRRTLDLAKGWNRLLLRVAPGEKDWYAVPVIHARGRCDYQETGIAWRTPLPGVHPAFYGGGGGVGSPVIVGDRLYLLSEPNDLICLDKTSGRILWIRRASYFEAATDDEKTRPEYTDAQALATKIDALNAAFVAGAASSAQSQEKSKLEKDLQKQMKLVDPGKYTAGVTPDVGYSGFTPSTDGRFIYAWFADGVTACYDLDGARRWIRVDQRPAVEHGFSSSPLLVDGKLVVFMRDLIAFDCDTGKLAWQIPVVSHEGLNPGGFFHGSLVAASIGKQNVVVLGNGTIVRAADGRELFKDPKLGNQSVASAVVDGGRIFQVTTWSMELNVRTLPEQVTDRFAPTTQTMPLDASAFPKHYVSWHIASPLVHQGLAYLLNNAGVLTVIDIETRKVVYQKLLDLDVFQGHNEGPFRGVGISPVLAGKHIYLMGNNGAAIVIEPGRTYRQVAKNKIESIVMLAHWSERQERFIANPVADGKRLFLRGEGNLYAIGRR
jgi:outer membrane protein assembly factor BamB